MRYEEKCRNYKRKISQNETPYPSDTDDLFDLQHEIDSAPQELGGFKDGGFFAQKLPLRRARVDLLVEDEENHKINARSYRLHEEQRNSCFIYSLGSTLCALTENLALPGLERVRLHRRDVRASRAGRRLPLDRPAAAAKRDWSPGIRLQADPKMDPTFSPMSSPFLQMDAIFEKFIIEAIVKNTFLDDRWLKMM